MNNPLVRSVLVASAIIACVVAASSCTRDHKTAGPAGPLTAADLSFPGMQMRPGGNASTFTLIGRVKNKSVHATISEVTLRMTMEDVLVSGAATTVGETKVFLRKEVPPAESRDFEEKVSFGDLPKPKGRFEWNYSVVEVKGK